MPLAHRRSAPCGFPFLWGAAVAGAAVLRIALAQGVSADEVEGTVSPTYLLEPPRGLTAGLGAVRSAPALAHRSPMAHGRVRCGEQHQTSLPSTSTTPHQGVRERRVTAPGSPIGTAPQPSAGAARRGWKNQGAVGEKACGWGQGRRLDMPGTENVEHHVSRSDQIVGDDSAVTSPPQSLSAHDGTTVFVAELAQFRKTRTKGRRHRVIGKVMKAIMTPKPIDLWRNTACFSAPAAEGAQVPIHDVELGQRCWQSLFVILRIGARAWDGADVRDKLNIRFLQDFNELLDRARRMSDREVRAHDLVI